MIRRSLTILRNVDPGQRAEIDSLIDRIEALSKRPTTLNAMTARKTVTLMTL